MTTENSGDRLNYEDQDPRLRWYPAAWRDRYGDELIALLDEEYGTSLPMSVRFGLLTGGLRQRARLSGLVGDSAPAVDGLRAGALLVLAAWTAFVIAGASFAKFSEHFDQALPHDAAAHRVPDVAYTVLQTVAGVASALVLLGALLAVPAFVQLVRREGMRTVRKPLLRALAATIVVGLTTVPLIVWAHHLTTQQRNGGLHWYGALVLVWAMVIALTLVLWTAVAIAAARRVVFPRAILAAEALLAVALAGAMAVIAVATAVWWAAMATDAPSFLHANPGGASSTPWDIWLIGTVLLMVGAVGVATAGVVREVRVWTAMRTR